jgi:transposase
MRSRWRCTQTSGRPARRDKEYRRCGTANVFGVVEPKAGRHFTCATADRSAAAFARIVRRIVQAYPTARTIHLVVDNLNTHREKALRDAFGPVEGARLWTRLTVHYTPKHGRWLNPAEIELSLVARQALGSSRFAMLSTLNRQVQTWATRANRRRTTMAWRFTRKDARRTFHYVNPLSMRSKY